MWYFCEILSLFAVFRTYRLAVVALIYALFVPAACITEALPFGGSSQSARKPKFFLSIIIWFFVLAITIAAIVVSESSDEIQEIRTIVVVAVGIAVGITMCASYGVHVKEVAGEAVSSQVKAVSIFKPFAPTWSNILALLAAPLETIQLSAVGNA